MRTALMIGFAGLLAGLSAAPARAAPDPQASALARAVRPSPRAQPHVAYAVAYDGAGPPRIRGVATTEIDRKLGREGVTGSMGFMCGLQPGQGRTGAAAATGYDPQGRFVGARLSLAFQ